MKLVIGKIPNISAYVKNIAIKRNRVFKEIAAFGKADIKRELRSPMKSGKQKSLTRISAFRGSTRRRSAIGESLARDTGASEKLITSDVQGNKLNIGFLEAPDGNNYVYEWEEVRPTIKNSMNKTMPKIDSIINKHFNL